MSSFYCDIKLRLKELMH